MYMSYKYRRNVQSVLGLNLAPLASRTLKNDSVQDDHVEQDRCQKREQKETVVDGQNNEWDLHDQIRSGDAGEKEVNGTRPHDRNFDEEVALASVFKRRRDGVELVC